MTGTELFDALTLMAHECEQADLPPGIKGIMIKTLALIPEAYLAGYQDAKNEKEKENSNGGGNQ